MVHVAIWIGIFGAASLFFAASMTTTTKDLGAPLKPGQRDRCPMCGMFVQPFPQWVAQVRLGDGSVVFFDGCKDLFKYLLSFERQVDEGKPKSITSIFVTNYYDGEIIAARTAHFVIGSDVMGPMGSELVPHRTLAAAHDFLHDHFGLETLRFDEINENTLRAME